MGNHYTPEEIIDHPVRQGLFIRETYERNEISQSTVRVFYVCRENDGAFAGIRDDGSDVMFKTLKEANNKRQEILEKEFE